MKNVEVGMFKLPGIVFEQGELNDELVTDMKAWAEAEGVGIQMTENLWSFRKEAQREWFILRWADHLQKKKEEE